MKDYRKEARDYIEKNMYIKADIADETYTDIDHIAEELINSLELEVPEGFTDEEYEAEADRQRIEIYDVLLTEYAEEVEKGYRIKELLNAIGNNAEVFEEEYNNNIWDVFGHLLDLTDEEIKEFEEKYLNK